MCFFLCLLLFSGLLCYLVVVPAVLPPMVGCTADIYQGHFRSFVLRMALVYPCSYSSAGECKAAGLIGLALAWYTAEPLCCALCTHTHTPALRSTVGQPRYYIALEPDVIHAPMLFLGY